MIPIYAYLFIIEHRNRLLIGVVCVFLVSITFTQKATAFDKYAHANYDLDISGVTALQQGATLLGHPFNTVEAIETLSTSQIHGMTFSTLGWLAKKVGLFSAYQTHISYSELRAFTGYGIVLIKSRDFSEKADCFVLISSSHLGVFASDRLGNSRRTSTEVIAQLWSGDILLLSDKSFSLDYHLMPAQISVLSWAFLAFLVGMFVCFRYISGFDGHGLRYQALFKPLIKRSMIMLGIGIIFSLSNFAISGQTISDADTSTILLQDFLNHSDLKNNDDNASPITPTEALVEYSHGDQFIDARDPEEYKVGHIRGAINCPASDGDNWKTYLVGIARNKHIVVYCASIECKKATYIANLLRDGGFTEVGLFKEGWAKWKGPTEIEASASLKGGHAIP